MNPRFGTSRLTQWLVGAVIPLVICIIGLGLYWKLGSSEPKKLDADGRDPASLLAKLPIISVGTIFPFDSTSALEIDVSGIVVPYRQVTVAAEIAGRVSTKNELCRVGHFVKEGDLLFQFDPTDFQLDIDRLTALRDTEYAQQRELDQELANAERSLELADQEVALQEQEIGRLNQLPEGFASQTELDQARRATLASQNQRLVIQNQSALLQTRRTRISLAERLAATQLEQAKVNLARTRIVAPITGVIVSESVEEDSYVPKGASLCTIDDTSHVEVTCNLRADQMLMILDQVSEVPAPSIDGVEPIQEQPNQYELPKTPVVIAYEVAGREDMVFRWEGILSRYDGIGLDPQSRTVPVRVRVEDPRKVLSNASTSFNQSGGPPALVRGMFVECTFQTKPKRPLMLIPKLALKPGNQVWSFVHDPSLIEAGVVSVSDVIDSEISGTDKPSTDASKKDTSQEKGLSKAASMIRIEDWMPGRVKVINQIRTIRSIRVSSEKNSLSSGSLGIQNELPEYWVAEFASGLKPGDLTVISPLANLIGDGSDKARAEVPKR